MANDIKNKDDISSMYKVLSVIAIVYAGAILSADINKTIKDKRAQEVSHKLYTIDYINDVVDYNPNSIDYLHDTYFLDASLFKIDTTSLDTKLGGNEDD